MAPRTKRATSAPLELGSTAALVAWMEREYLSELTLSDLRPAPSETGAPESIQFTWWLHAGGARTPYRVEATGVTDWSLEGELDEATAISIPPPAAQTAAPIVLTMRVPGRLVLACDRLLITRGKAVRMPAPPRAFTEYAYFTLDGVGSPTAEAVARGLADDAQVCLRSRSAALSGALGRGSADLVLGDRALATVFYDPVRADGWLSIARKQATDLEWHRAQALPRHLPASVVCSAWEVRCDPAAWLALVRPP